MSQVNSTQKFSYGPTSPYCSQLPPIGNYIFSFFLKIKQFSSHHKETNINMQSFFLKKKKQQTTLSSVPSFFTHTYTHILKVPPNQFIEFSHVCMHHTLYNQKTGQTPELPDLLLLEALLQKPHANSCMWSYISRSYSQKQHHWIK